LELLPWSPEPCKSAIKRFKSKGAYLWWTSPEFIAKEEIILPAAPDIDFTTSAHVKLAKTQPNLTHPLVASNQSGLATLMNIHRYSSINTLFSITAYVLRFVDALKGRRVEGESLMVSAAEIKRAEAVWIRTVQQNSFEVELKFLLSPSGS